MSLFDMMSQPRQQATPTTGLGLLLGEAQKTAGMFGGQVGKTLGIDTRDKREIELDAIKKAIAGAEGETLQERLANAIPAIAEVNPVLGIAFAEQLRGMTPTNTQVVNIDTGRYPEGMTAQQANVLGVSTIKRKALVNTITGDVIRYIGEDEAPSATKPEGTPAPTEDKRIKVGAGQFIPRGSLNGKEVTAETTKPPQVTNQNTFPVPKRPKLKVEDKDSPRAGAVRSNVVLGVSEESTPKLKARLKNLNKKGMLTPKERQELFEIQTELDKRK